MIQNQDWDAGLPPTTMRTRAASSISRSIRAASPPGPIDPVLVRAVSLTDTPRGPFHFDHFGHVVGSFYIRRCEKKGDKLVNTTIKTYPKVSQFWTYDEKWFLSQPVYSRDYPPLKS